MKCTVCGANLRPVHTDLPFKTSEHAIVILKSLPVLQCENCANYLIEDKIMARIDDILATVAGLAELEVVRFAA